MLHPLQTLPSGLMAHLSIGICMIPTHTSMLIHDAPAASMHLQCLSKGAIQVFPGAGTAINTEKLRTKAHPQPEPVSEPVVEPTTLSSAVQESGGLPTADHQADQAT